MSVSAAFGAEVSMSDGWWVLNLDVGCSNGWTERVIPPATRIVGAWLDEHGDVDDTVEASL